MPVAGCAAASSSVAGSVAVVAVPVVVCSSVTAWALYEARRAESAEERARAKRVTANKRAQQAAAREKKARGEAAAANDRAQQAERARDQGHQEMQEAQEREERARDEAAAANERAQQAEHALRQERERVHTEKLRRWMDLNREYPIPVYLQPYVTGVNDSSEEPTGGGRFVNVGVLGNSGVGKSCLIKAMLEYFHAEEAGHEPAACLQGNGTAIPTPYALKRLGERVHIWDLPGQGTKDIPKKTYLKAMGLKYFDAVLVATSGRWLENDEALLQAVKFAEIWVCVVRTKMDQAVQDGKADNDLSQEEVLQQTREKLAQDLGGPDSTTIHLVTVRRQYWVGEDGSMGFGTIGKLCEEVAERVRSQQNV